MRARRISLARSLIPFPYRRQRIRQCPPRLWVVLKCTQDDRPNLNPLGINVNVNYRLVVHPCCELAYRYEVLSALTYSGEDSAHVIGLLCPPQGIQCYVVQVLDLSHQLGGSHVLCVSMRLLNGEGYAFLAMALDGTLREVVTSRYVPIWNALQERIIYQSHMPVRAGCTRARHYRPGVAPGV